MMQRNFKHDFVSIMTISNFWSTTESMCDDYLGTECDEKQLCADDEDMQINGNTQR